MYAILIANEEYFFIIEASDRIDAFNKAIAVYGDRRVYSYSFKIL